MAEMDGSHPPPNPPDQNSQINQLGATLEMLPRELLRNIVGRFTDMKDYAHCYLLSKGFGALRGADTIARELTIRIDWVNAPEHALGMALAYIRDPTQVGSYCSAANEEIFSSMINSLRCMNRIETLRLNLRPSGAVVGIDFFLRWVQRISSQTQRIKNFALIRAGSALTEEDDLNIFGNNNIEGVLTHEEFISFNSAFLYHNHNAYGRFLAVRRMVNEGVRIQGAVISDSVNHGEMVLHNLSRDQLSVPVPAAVSERLSRFWYIPFLRLPSLGLVLRRVNVVVYDEWSEEDLYEDGLLKLTCQGEDHRVLTLILEHIRLAPVPAHLVLPSHQVH